MLFFFPLAAAEWFNIRLYFLNRIDGVLIFGKSSNG